jgi:hypothetical protein
MNNRTKERFLPVTNSGPRPGDFPLGSPLSRAASRALLERMEQDSEKIHVVIECIGAPEKTREFWVPRLSLSAGRVRP